MSKKTIDKSVGPDTYSEEDKHNESSSTLLTVKKQSPRVKISTFRQIASKPPNVTAQSFQTLSFKQVLLNPNLMSPRAMRIQTSSNPTAKSLTSLKQSLYRNIFSSH